MKYTLLLRKNSNKRWSHFNVENDACKNVWLGSEKIYEAFPHWRTPKLHFFFSSVYMWGRQFRSSLAVLFPLLYEPVTRSFCWFSRISGGKNFSTYPYFIHLLICNLGDWKGFSVNIVKLQSLFSFLVLVFQVSKFWIPDSAFLFYFEG